MMKLEYTVTVDIHLYETPPCYFVYYEDIKHHECGTCLKDEYTINIFCIITEFFVSRGKNTEEKHVIYAI